MISIGTRCDLKVLKVNELGALMDAENLGTALLPKRWQPAGCAEGDVINVFLYHDSEDRLTATTQRARASVGEFAYLKVMDVNDVGAFLDWGLSKHLLVPYSEQRRTHVLEPGDSCVVYVFEGEETGRVLASVKLEEFMLSLDPALRVGDPVDLLICGRTELGYKAIINNESMGLIFHSDVIGALSVGKRIPGYIKTIRDDDKVDLILQPLGKARYDVLTTKILDALKQQNGFLPLTDKSDPKLIFDQFGVSKRAFKQTIGTLYKQQLITIEKDGLRLV